jgi:predicted aspartyl protease
MTSTLPVAIAATLALAPSLVPVSAQTAYMPAVLPFSDYDRGAIVVPVSIGGAGPYRFLLDTGSTRSAISTTLARHLRTAVVAQTLMITPAGNGNRNVTIVPALQVGHSRPVSVAVMVLPNEALARAGGVDGLLGQDVLAKWSYTIDYRRRELVWHARGAGEVPGHRLPLTSANGLPFVELPTLLGTAGPVRLIADSGADAIVLFATAGRPIRSATPMETGLIKTSTGLQVGHRIQLDELTLGTLTLRNQPALLLPARQDTGLLGDGLLPLSLFARVTFDAAAGALIVVAR